MNNIQKAFKAKAALRLQPPAVSGKPIGTTLRMATTTMPTAAATSVTGMADGGLAGSIFGSGSRQPRPTPTVPTTIGIRGAHDDDSDILAMADGGSVTNDLVDAQNEATLRPMSSFANGGLAKSLTDVRLQYAATHADGQRPPHFDESGTSVTFGTVEPSVSGNFANGGCVDPTIGPNNGQFSNGGMAHYGLGGAVRGPGTGTSDSIPAMLSHGEYVLPADTVRKVGVAKLNGLKAATHTPVHMADGGTVGDAPYDFSKLPAQHSKMITNANIGYDAAGPAIVNPNNQYAAPTQQAPVQQTPAPQASAAPVVAPPASAPASIGATHMPDLSGVGDIANAAIATNSLRPVAPVAPAAAPGPGIATRLGNAANSVASGVKGAYGRVMPERFGGAPAASTPTPAGTPLPEINPDMAGAPLPEINPGVKGGYGRVLPEINPGVKGGYGRVLPEGFWPTPAAAAAPSTSGGLRAALNPAGNATTVEGIAKGAYNTAKGAYDTGKNLVGKVVPRITPAGAILGSAVGAGLEGAIRGINTTNDEYALRLGLDGEQRPDGVRGYLKSLALRSAGVMSDVGAAAINTPGDVIGLAGNIMKHGVYLSNYEDLNPFGDYRDNFADVAAAKEQAAKDGLAGAATRAPNAATQAPDESWAPNGTRAAAAPTTTLAAQAAAQAAAPAEQPSTDRLLPSGQRVSKEVADAYDAQNDLNNQGVARRNAQADRELQERQYAPTVYASDYAPGQAPPGAIGAAPAAQGLGRASTGNAAGDAANNFIDQIQANNQQRLGLRGAQISNEARAAQMRYGSDIMGHQVAAESNANTVAAQRESNQATHELAQSQQMANIQAHRDEMAKAARAQTDTEAAQANTVLQGQQQAKKDVIEKLSDPKDPASVQKTATQYDNAIADQSSALQQQLAGTQDLAGKRAIMDKMTHLHTDPEVQGRITAGIKAAQFAEKQGTSTFNPIGYTTPQSSRVPVEFRQMDNGDYAGYDAVGSPTGHKIVARDVNGVFGPGNDDIKALINHRYDKK